MLLRKKVEHCEFLITKKETSGEWIKSKGRVWITLGDMIEEYVWSYNDENCLLQIEDTVVGNYEEWKYDLIMGELDMFFMELYPYVMQSKFNEKELDVAVKTIRKYYRLAV